jgi:hypothetical protein
LLSLNSFTIDQLETGKHVLDVFFVFATGGVWLGVWLENEKFSKSARTLGWRILVLCLGAEVLFSVLIMQADTDIDRRQKDEIVALETKLAPRSLSKSDLSEIAAHLKQFAGQEFNMISYGGEPASIAARLRQALEKAEWKWYKPGMQGAPPAGTVGIQIWAYSDGPARNAANALVGALNAKEIEAALLPEQPQPQDPNPNRVDIVVGSKF